MFSTDMFGDPVSDSGPPVEGMQQVGYVVTRRRLVLWGGIKVTMIYAKISDVTPNIAVPWLLLVLLK